MSTIDNPTSMIFIDGTNFDRMCREKFFRIDIDYSKLFSALSRGTKLLHVFYATAPYKLDLNPDWYSHQVGTLNWLRKMPNVTIMLHQHRKRTQKCTKCGQISQTLKEKGTDVSIAASFVEAAVNRSASELILLSNDSDFGPIAPIAKKYGCKTGLAYVLGRGDNDFSVRTGLTPLSTTASRLIRINEELLSECWIKKS